MSITLQDKKKTDKKKFRLDAKFFARVVVLLLAIAMLAGTFYYALVFAFAKDETKALSASTDDLMIRIALIYTSSVTVEFKTVTDYGFSLGFNDKDNNFTEVVTTSATELRICPHRNLLKKNGTYTLATSEKSVTVGGYHVRIKCDTDEVYSKLSEVAEAFPEENVFPAYYDGVKYIMIGQYVTEKEAKTALKAVKDKLLPKPEETTAPDTVAVEDTTADTETTTATETDAPSETTTSEETTAPAETEAPEPSVVLTELQKAVESADISKQSPTAVVSIDPAADKIVWLFDDTSDATYMGASAIQMRGSYSYINGYKGTTKYKYDYVLECRVVDDEDGYGISVINVLPLEKYVTGVVPYEISNQWPLETQKAFIIAVRSYAIANIGRHSKTYGADLCCGSNCQVYKGFGSTNDLVRQAAEETKGVIAVYGDSICSTFYSSSTGGCTANVSDVWGSSQKVYGYLKAVPTPWEKYEDYGNGSWTSSATGKQLYERLNAKGYTGLKGDVVKIETTLGEGSSYVKTATFYDASGNKVTVSRTDKVKSLLSPYVKSANFIVGKAGSKVTRTNYTMLGFGGVNTGSSEGLHVITNPFDYTVSGNQEFSVLTSKGSSTFNDSDSEYVATANGTLNFNMSLLLNSQYFPTIEGNNGDKIPDILKLDPIVQTETIVVGGTSGEFVFIGRGWGHGVGLSQWGTKDLGDMGYDYETIIKAYYSDIDLVQYDEFTGK